LLRRTRDSGGRLVDGLGVLQLVGLGHLLEEGRAVDLLDGDVLDLRGRLVDGLGVLEGGTLADGGLELSVHVGGVSGVFLCGSGYVLGSCRPRGTTGLL
jgi:hypothetical protein